MSDTASPTVSDAGPAIAADSALLAPADLVEIVRAVETLYLPPNGAWDADEGDDTAAIGVPIDMLAGDDCGESFLLAADPLAAADMPFDEGVAFAAWSVDALVGFDPMLEAMSSFAEPVDGFLDAVVSLRGDALGDDLGGAHVQASALSWIADGDVAGFAATHVPEIWSWDVDAGACVFGGIA